jgi:hypothetical protein
MSLWLGEKTHLKKKTNLYWVLSSHLGFGLTQRDNRFSPGQLQARVLNKIDSAKASGHPSLGLTRQARPGLIIMVLSLFESVI